MIQTVAAFRISSARGAHPSGGRRRAAPVDPAPAAGNDTTSRALVPAARRAEADLPPAGRPSAAFIAQLLAHRLDLPQTRARRRAPCGAAALYAPRRLPVQPAGRRLDVSS